MSDFRLALRVLARSPLLTAVVVLSLALGIGANTAIFSFMHQMVMRALPVQDPEGIALLRSPGEFKSGRQSTSTGGGMDAVFSYRMFRELEKERKGIAALAAFRSFSANLSFGKQTVDGSANAVSGSYFSALGVRPLAGRLITPEDDVHGAGRPVAVLSHAYWQGRLGGDLQALNQPLRVNGNVFTIVGIAPKGFTGTVFGEQPDVFVPVAMKPALTPGWDGTDKWDDYWLYCFARLRPGSTMAQAEAALNANYRGLVEEQAQATPNTWRRPGSRERFLKSRLSLVEGSHGFSQVIEGSRTPLTILMAATGLVLLIAVANTANVLLARGAQRKKELAIRTALGAGRWRLARQTLAEALLLSVSGGAAGLFFAYWTVNFIAFRITRGEPSEYLTARLEWPVLLFALGVSIVSGLLCGAYPAIDAARSPVSGALKDESGQSSATRGAARLRKTLVVAQVAISALLLVPAGLFMKSLINLMRVDLGLNTANVIMFGISPELNGYTPERSRALFERAEAELAAIPGVRGVTTAMVPLIAGSNWGNSVTAEGYSTDPNADTMSFFNVIGPGFFGKFGVPLINGREFTDRDAANAPKVAIVNQTFAKHFFEGRNPIGRRFGLGLGPDTKLDYEIVGLVADSHYSGVRQEPPRLYYTAWRQSEDVGSLFFYVRTALEPEAIMPEVRRVMGGLDRDLPLVRLQTLDEQVDRNIMTDRIVVQLASMFASLATLLAMLGLYGVMTYGVTRRTREFGIRVALGAEPGRVRTMVMREAGVILAIGLVLGLPAALGVARLTESQLFGVKSFDAVVLACATAALALAAGLAAYIPARRAARVSPMSALRYE